MKSIKKIVSVILTIAALSAIMSVSFTVNAVENGAIHVIVENSVYSVEDGAAWDGVLVDEWIDIDSDTTMMSAVVTALTENGYTQTGAEYGYISEINGLSDGWMGALNDWFTNEGYSAYTVEAGTLEAGDEIHMMYSLNWGYDVGSQWGNSDTSLAGLAFSSGALTESFNSAVTEYTLILPADETNITVTPSAVNKNFQVRTYKNEYTPTVEKSEYKRTSAIELSDGDALYIGVGNSNWPTMEADGSETLYKINVVVSDSILGDVNCDGTLNVTDCTEIQRYIIGAQEFTAEQTVLADFDKNGSITVADVTEIQKSIVGA